MATIYVLGSRYVAFHSVHYLYAERGNEVISINEGKNVIDGFNTPYIN